MSEEIKLGLIVIIFAIASYWIKQSIIKWMWLRRIQKKKKSLTEPKIKIMFNPFFGDVGEMFWTKYNPKTRTWEWVRVATMTEVDQYNGVIFSEESGEKIMQLHENIMKGENING